MTKKQAELLIYVAAVEGRSSVGNVTQASSSLQSGSEVAGHAGAVVEQSKPFLDKVFQSTGPSGAV